MTNNGNEGAESGTTPGSTTATALSEPVAETQIYLIPLGQIRVYRNQPRSEIDKQKLEDLVASIREKGQLEAGEVKLLSPPDGKFRYELISGERRFTACEANKLPHFRSTIRRDSMTEIDQFEDALVINCCREDMSPMDLARGMRRLMREKEYKVEKVADRVGKKVPTVKQYLSLFNLCTEVQELMNPKRGNKQLPLTIALKLTRFPVEFQIRRAKEILRDSEPEAPRMGMREAELHIESSRIQAQLPSIHHRPTREFDKFADFVVRTKNQFEQLGKLEDEVLRHTVEGRTKGDSERQKLIRDLNQISEFVTKLTDRVQKIVKSGSGLQPSSNPKLTTNGSTKAK